MSVRTVPVSQRVQRSEGGGGAGEAPLPATLIEKAMGFSASASSVESASVFTAAKANDGSDSTRWASGWATASPGNLAFEAWWAVDLTTARPISRLVIKWEYSYSPSYKVQYSTDGLSWSDASAAITTDDDQATYTHDFTEVEARYWRILTAQRRTESAAGGWGVSAYRIELWGAQDDVVLPPPPPAPDPGAPTFWQTWHSLSPYTAVIPDSAPVLDAATQASFRTELRYCANVSACGWETGVWSGRNGVIDGMGVEWPDGTSVGSGSNVPVSGVGQMMSQVPYVSGFLYTGGEEHHSLYRPSTHEYYEWYEATGSGSGISGGYGAAGKDTSLLKQMNEEGPGGNNPESPWRGANAAGIPMSVTTVADHEIRDAVDAYDAEDFENAYIPHLIGYEAYRHHPNQWHYPATKTDDMGAIVPSWGVGGNANRGNHGLGVLRMGGIARVKPTLDVMSATFGLSDANEIRLARIIALTLQKHGMTMCDWTGAGLVLLLENRSSTYDVRAGSGSNHSPYMRTLFNWLCDNAQIEWLFTGRNYEIDTGGSPETGAYRPG